METVGCNGSPRIDMVLWALQNREYLRRDVQKAWDECTLLGSSWLDSTIADMNSHGSEDYCGKVKEKSIVFRDGHGNTLEKKPILT